MSRNPSQYNMVSYTRLGNVINKIRRQKITLEKNKLQEIRVYEKYEH